MKKFFHGLVATAVLVTAGCQDLDTINTNNPDREIALQNPADVEVLIHSAWRNYFVSVHNRQNINYLFPTIAVEMASGSNERALITQSVIPRPEFNNNPFATTLTDPLGSRDAWRDWHSVLSSVNEGLAEVDRGMRFVSGTGAAQVDNTVRTQSFAYFVQGLAWGQLALAYDRATVIDENMPIPANPETLAQLVRDQLLPYPEVLARALQSFDSALALAEANSFTIPAEWMRTAAPMNNVDFARLIRTYAARHIVYNARTPEERQNLDWQRVLNYTAAGITQDFTPILATGAGSLSSNLYQTAQRNVAACVTCFRASYWLIGPADVSGAYQTWEATPLQEREQFNIVTPDRRITGPQPTQRGAYFIHRNNEFGQSGGVGGTAYMRSRYQWFRNNGNHQQGNAFMLTVAEQNLLRAEAMLRTGRLDEAAQLVNFSRTREVTIPELGTFPGLPPVTAAGVPQSADCVPRTETGACGGLALALEYERMIEGALADVTRAYGDRRGWGRLPTGTWLHLPVPGVELDLLGMDVYTYGGGGEWSAP
jgi:hypothetical protein